MAAMASKNEAIVLPFLNSNLPFRMLFIRKFAILSFSRTALKSPDPRCRMNRALMNYLSVKVSF